MDNIFSLSVLIKGESILLDYHLFVRFYTGRSYVLEQCMEVRGGVRGGARRGARRCVEGCTEVRGGVRGGARRCAEGCAEGYAGVRGGVHGGVCGGF